MARRGSNPRFVLIVVLTLVLSLMCQEIASTGRLRSKEGCTTTSSASIACHVKGIGLNEALETKDYGEGDESPPQFDYDYDFYRKHGDIPSPGRFGDIVHKFRVISRWAMILCCNGFWTNLVSGLLHMYPLLLSLYNISSPTPVNLQPLSHNRDQPHHLLVLPPAPSLPPQHLSPATSISFTPSPALSSLYCAADPLLRSSSSLSHLATLAQNLATEASPGSSSSFWFASHPSVLSNLSVLIFSTVPCSFV
ncbi:hypothetical protein RIF29_11187 [Crotalaria pallida]|uniref:Uncharacterized protein n=1 Tax=Crotalaria pallida TaxID=3830 RepID=A0AAN9ILW0_CROPI